MLEILRRGTVLTALVAVSVVVLQAGDATTVVPLVSAPSPVLKSQSPLGVAAEREFFVTHTRWIPFGRSSIHVPILMYHYIRAQPSIYIDRVGFNLSVPPATFNTQMDWLAKNGFHPIDFEDLRAYFAGTRLLPDKPIVLTFDDGYQDLYTNAYPVLRAYHFKAVAYIVTSFVGQPGYVNSGEVLEMDRNGIAIASHTIDHANLAKASFYWATYQLSTSQVWLQGLVGHPVVDFAYPSGRFNAQVIRALQATGYDTAVTELPGTLHSRDDRYTWTRMRVGGGESMWDFIQNLGPEETPIVLKTINSTTGEP